jgi:hypothetical protein
MKPNTPYDGIANLLADLTEKQMVETIYSALRKRGADWVLAVSELLPNGKSRLDLFSPHDPETYPDGWSDDAVIANLGECGHCGATLFSWAKRVICPVCGSKANCT